MRRSLDFDILECRLPLSGGQVPVTVEPAPVGPTLGTQPAPVVIPLPTPDNGNLDGTGPTADPVSPLIVIPPVGSFPPIDPNVALA